MDFKEIQKRIETMSKEVESLKNDLKLLSEWKSRKERQQIKNPIDLASLEVLSRDIPILGKSTGSYETQEIELTGSPQTINVPEQPSGTIAVKARGKIYNLLYQ